MCGVRAQYALNTQARLIKVSTLTVEHLVNGEDKVDAEVCACMFELCGLDLALLCFALRLALM